MTSLAHISDVHFGREDPVLVSSLVEFLHAHKPDIVVVSGDFTQRAKKRQFRAARAFLHKLPQVPHLYVPGNHDVSATNLLERALRPLRRYRRYITPDLAPFLDTGSVAIAGIDTVRVLKSKDGRINPAQVTRACQQLATASAEAIRVVVTHHPLDLPPTDTAHALVTRAPAAMQVFAKAGVDLFLSGHLHGGLSLTSAARYPIAGYAAVMAHAGTAVSVRTRKEPNGWNLIELERDRIEIHQIAWNGKAFAPSHTAPYVRSAQGWVRS